MRPREFATVSPTFYRDLRLGDFLISHERYRGLFAAEHAHPEFQIQVFLKGRIHVAVGQQRHLLGPGNLLVMPAGLVHCSSHLDDQLELLNVMVPAGWLDLQARDLGRPALPTDRARVTLDPFLRALAQRLTAGLTTRGPALDRLMTAGLELIALSIVGSTDEALESAGDPRIDQAVARILADCSGPLTIESLANEAAMTPRHFDRCFKEALGVSPKRFILATRIRVSRELLARTGLSITEIAQEVGFGDATHFIRTFKAAVGATPGAYRLRPGEPG